MEVNTRLPKNTNLERAAGGSRCLLFRHFQTYCPLKFISRSKVTHDQKSFMHVGVLTCKSLFNTALISTTRIDSSILPSSTMSLLQLRYADHSSSHGHALSKLALIRLSPRRACHFSFALHIHIDLCDLLLIEAEGFSVQQ